MIDASKTKKAELKGCVTESRPRKCAVQYPFRKRDLTDGEQPLELDARKWMHMLRFEDYGLSSLRTLEVGERLWVAHFKGPGVTDKAKGHCEAYFERVRGGFMFAAVWTVFWKRPMRAHIMTFGHFQLRPGDIIRFPSKDDMDSERAFRLVCRYTEFINRHHKDYGFEQRPKEIFPLHIIWRGEAIYKNGRTCYGDLGPIPQGLLAIIETGIAMGILPLKG